MGLEAHARHTVLDRKRHRHRRRASRSRRGCRRSTTRLGRRRRPTAATQGVGGMPARLGAAEITDPSALAEQITPAIAETVKRQVETGIDCIGHPICDLLIGGALPPPHEQVRTQRRDAITDDCDSDRSRTGRLFARALCHDLAAVMPSVALVAPLFGKALAERTKINHNSLLSRCNSFSIDVDHLCRRAHFVACRRGGESIVHLPQCQRRKRAMSAARVDGSRFLHRPHRRLRAEQAFHYMARWGAPNCRGRRIRIRSQDEDRP